MEQVHKETLEQVENAIPGREGVDLEIFGTEGIPEQEVAAHNQRILSEFARAEADKRAASGQSNGPKKPRIDLEKELDPDEIRRKLEAHKRAMAAGPGAAPGPMQTENSASMNPQGSPPQGQAYVSTSPARSWNILLIETCRTESSSWLSSHSIRRPTCSLVSAPKLVRSARCP